MDTILQYPLAVLSSLQELTLQVWTALPNLIAGILLLVVGLFIGHWVRTLSDTVLKAVRADDYSRQLGLSTVLTRLGLGASLMNLIGMVAYVTILIPFVLVSADAVHFTTASEFMRRTVEFLPRCAAAIFVLGVGLYLGDVLGRMVHRAADANRIKGSETLMRATHAVMVIFSGIVGLEYLGVDIMVINNYLPIVIGSLGLGFAIAMGVSFGLAGRDSAERWIRDLTPKSSSRPVMSNGHEPKMRLVK